MKKYKPVLKEEKDVLVAKIKILDNKFGRNKQETIISFKVIDSKDTSLYKNGDVDTYNTYTTSELQSIKKGDIVELRSSSSSTHGTEYIKKI